MKVKQALKEVRSYRLEIKEMRTRKEEIISTLTGRAIQYDKDRIQTSPADLTPEVMVKAFEIDRKIEKMIKALGSIYSQCLDCIQQIDRSEYRRLLMLRYMDDSPNSWAKIAMLMNYTEDTVKHWHSKALEEADRHWEG